MTISYNPSIPQSNDLISNSQPQILQNFGSINTLVGIDHYSFASGSGGTPPAGEHKQITFGSTNPASPNPPGQVTVSPPVLFTNTVDGAGNALPNSVPELFFYSGTHQQGQDNYVSQSNGSTVLMGGIILKWGTVTGINSGTSKTFTFPGGGFPNACWVAFGTVDQPPGPYSASVTGLSQTQATVSFNSTAGATSSSVFVLAIGN